MYIACLNEKLDQYNNLKTNLVMHILFFSIYQTCCEFNWSPKVQMAVLPFRDTTIYNIRANKLAAGWGTTSPYQVEQLPTLQKLNVEVMHPQVYERYYHSDNVAPRTDIFYGHTNYNGGYGTAQVTCLCLK